MALGPIKKLKTMNFSVSRYLPDGSFSIVMPFHICLKGLEDAVLCRDDEDYDMFVKIIFLASWSKNVIVVIYSVLSNHFHASVLAASQEDADACGEEIKRRYSMWLSRKYLEKNTLCGARASALIIKDKWHLRNTLAYIPRNALDNGQNVDTYKWSGYRGMFCRKQPEGLRPVSSLSRREVRIIFHSGDKLDRVPWELNELNEIEPVSACDHAYLEQAFGYDQAFFMKTIGSLNIAEIRYSVEEQPFNMTPDTEFRKIIDDVSVKWYGKNLSGIPLGKKYGLLPYVYRTSKTTVSQLARVFALDRETVRAVIGIK